MPVDIDASADLSLEAAIPADTIALGVVRDHDSEQDAVVIALQGHGGDWVAFQGTPEDARDMAYALLEKAEIAESGVCYATI